MENLSTLRDGHVAAPLFAQAPDRWEQRKTETASRFKLLVLHDGYREFGYEIADLQKAGLPADSEVEILTVADLLLPPLYLADGDTPDLGYYCDTRIGGQYGLAYVSEIFHIMDKSSRSARAKLQAAFPDWNVRNTVSAELPSRAVVDKAVRWRPDLVVIGSANLTWMERRGLRRLTQRLIAETRCSVRIVRPPRVASEMPTRIMIGFDASTQAAAALAAVGQRRWAAGSEAYLVSCVEPLITDEVNWAHDYIELDRRRAEQELAMAKTLLEESGLKVTTMIPIGDPAQSMIEEAKRLNVESIFLGSRELGLIGSLLFRSVSTHVATRAECSVEIARAAPEPQPRAVEQRLAA